jgi:hypothetical protein
MAHGGRREGAGRKVGSVSKLDGEARAKAQESGMMPLDYLLSIMRDETQDASVRRDAAKAAAPIAMLDSPRPRSADQTAAPFRSLLRRRGFSTFRI